jgi:hypothetical protein
MRGLRPFSFQRVAACCYRPSAVDKKKGWNMDGIDLQRELAFQAMLIADWKQTRQIARASDLYFERNPILGKHPSVGRVNTYMFTAGVLHWVISENLSPKWRERWQLISFSIQANTVQQNYAIGLAVDF